MVYCESSISLAMENVTTKTIASIWRENMLGYLSSDVSDVIGYEKRAVSLPERSP